jgi:hypothetical protein
MLGKALSLAAGLLAFGLVAAPASAAPIGNLNGIAENTSAAQAVHYRRCWRHYGHWHCRRAHRRHYYYGYYPRRYYHSYYYPRRYYYGYAPGFSFHFGGPRRWHRHWW